MLNPGFAPCLRKGFIESQSVPFRMTPNLVAFVGQPYLEDRFITSFAMVSEAIRENKDDFDPILRLLMRDDILAWYSKSLAKSDSKTQELEKQLIERVTQNVATLQLRFAECAPRKKTETRQDPVDKKVRQLYAASTNAEKICMMPTSYAAWL
jgi:transformation/transcription domain-associated protein